jgi:hypothetical protein
METYYTYIFVRSDLTESQKLCQIGHCCQEAGKLFDIPAGSHIVLLKAGKKESFLNMISYIESHSIKVHVFYERDPEDNPLGWTAACTEPVSGDKRNIFKKFRLKG